MARSPTGCACHEVNLDADQRILGVICTSASAPKRLNRVAPRRDGHRQAVHRQASADADVASCDVLEVGSRRIVHWNVTDPPTADWTIQQFRMTITGKRPYRYLVHERDRIFASAVDDAVASMGLRVLKTPVRTPQANALCERLIGTIRRECLDWLIPLGERHLRQVLTEWVAHYHRGRPHASLGPGTATLVTPAAAVRTWPPRPAPHRGDADLGGPSP